jgi:tetratricopeptide (TPR) repeat protein
MQGEFDMAREMYRRARRGLLELGWNFDAALVSIDSGPIEMLAGDPAAAVDELRGDYDVLDRMEERNYITTTAAYLAEALFRAERHDEADVFATFSETTAAPDDNATQCLWRVVRAKLLSRGGRHEEGVEMAREAVRLARRSDDPVSLGDALVCLAQTLALAGRHPDAQTALDEAIERFEQKGSVASITVAHQLLDGALVAVDRP